MSGGGLRVELPDEAAVSLVDAVVEAMVQRGMVVPKEGRTCPFSVAELVKETGMSGTQVRRMIEAGVFDRVPHTGRCLVTVESVRRWQRGEVGKGGRA